MPRAGEGGVVVCGGGAAGMAAALAAARAGADVFLVEASDRLGGTVARTLIHTLGGLYDSAGEPLNGGLAQELVLALEAADQSVGRRRLGRAWVLNVCPDTYEAVVRCWLAGQARLTVLLRSRVTRLGRARDRIEEVVVSGRRGATTIRRPRGVVDATGSAEVVRLLDPDLLQDDRRAGGQAGGLIVRLRGVEPGTLTFPKGLAVLRAVRAAAADGTLPAECAHAWLDSGARPDEAYVKLFVPPAGDWRDPEVREALAGRARRQAGAAVAFLRCLPGFATAGVDRVGELGVRDGGRVRGEYVLTAEDVRQGRKFADAACRCAWPIEYWAPEGGVSLEYLPEHSHYEIPLRALRVRGVRNLWAAGKCLSADALAQASARVAGTCWSMGEAAGRCAAGCAAGGFAWVP